MSNQDGRVIINIDSNASKVARDFQNLTNDTSKYERILRNVAGTSNATLPIYDKIRAKLKEQQAAANSAIASYQKLANAQKSGIGFSQLNSVTGSAIERLKNLALQGRQNSAEFQKLASVVRSANSQMQNADNVVNAAISGSKGLSGAMGSLGGSLGSIAKLLPAIGTGFVALKLENYAQYALSTSAAFEQLAISFRVMTGSAQTGQELTDAIIELGAKTPMTAQQLSKAAQLLLSFGESAENIIPDLKLLGDITGGEVNRFNMLALAFAQVGANGKLMGQDLLQMVNAGFNPLQIMSQTTGKSMGELRKEMEEGRISFQMVAQAMRDAASEGGRYFGLMEQQSQSLNGRLSTLGDTWELVAKNIGDVFMPIAKGAVELLINIGESAQWVTGKLKEFAESMDYSTVDRQANIVAEMRNRREQYQQMLSSAQASGNKSQALFLTKQIENLDAAIERSVPKLQKLAEEQKKMSAPSIGSKGFAATVLSPNNTQKGKSEKVKGPFALLQEAATQAKTELDDLAAKGITSGKVWDSQVAKVNNLSAALERAKQATDLSVIPPFQALNTEIQKAQERVNNLAASKAETSPYQQKQNAISRLQSQYLDLAIQGQGNSAAAISIKNTWKQYQNEVTRAQNSLQNAVGLSWSQISSTISTQLSSALTTPLQEGENAFERLGNVALNVIGQIAQAWLSSSLMNFFNGSSGGKGLGTRFGNAAKGAAAGSAGGIWGAVGGAISGFFNANGNAFSHGRVLPFAQGGVVSSPTMFPMAGNRTGIMGEKGAEAIMPLKRAPNGQLGVQAQTAPATVNIYNQSDSRIETVQRPDGETDIFIRRVNNALRNERTQAGFSSALQRNQSRGVQAS